MTLVDIKELNRIYQANKKRALEAEVDAADVLQIAAIATVVDMLKEEKGDNNKSTKIGTEEVEQVSASTEDKVASDETARQDTEKVFDDTLPLVATNVGETRIVDYINNEVWCKRLSEIKEIRMFPSQEVTQYCMLVNATFFVLPFWWGEDETKVFCALMKQHGFEIHCKPRGMEYCVVFCSPLKTMESL